MKYPSEKVFVNLFSRPELREKKETKQHLFFQYQYMTHPILVNFFFWKFTLEEQTLGFQKLFGR